MRLLMIVSALAAIQVTPAIAQRATEGVTGSRIPIPQRARIPDGADNVDAARIAMMQFARCTVDRAPAETEAALRMPLGPNYNKAMASLADSECLASGEMRFNPALFRGSLFTELWRRRVFAERTGKRWGPVLAPFDLTAFATADDVTKQHLALMDFADCIVKRDRADASDVLTSPIAGKSQAAAYSRLIPNLGPCMQAGVSLKFSRPVLEGAIAEVLYVTPTPPSAASGNR